MKSLSALGAAASGAGSLIDAVGNLLPSTTTATGHTETKASANSDTRSGQLEIGSNSTTGSSNTKGTKTDSGLIKGMSSELGGTGQTSSTTGSATENFSGQENSTTTQTMLTDEGVMRIVNMMLQGNGGVPGLAETVTGERAGGLFDSTTNSLLTSNLVATIGGEVARLSAPTVQTQSLGSTQTTSANNTSSLMDAVTRALTNTSQSSRNNETTDSTTNTQEDVLNMVMSLAQQLTDQSSESTTDNKTKTKSKKFPTYICTFLQEVLPEYAGSQEFKALEEFKTQYLVPLKPFTIAKYDKIGPPIVAELEKLPDAEKIAEATRIRQEFILPAADAYNQGDSAEALSIYSDMVYSLQDTYKTKE